MITEGFGHDNYWWSFISKLQFSSDEKADEIAAFFTANAAPGMDRTVGQSVERIRITSEWVKHVQREEGVSDTIKRLASKKL